MFQIQDQSQRPLTTAHLAQTMSLLLLSNQELKDKVISELAENPALELVEENVCPQCKKRLRQPGPCPVCSRKADGDEPIVFLSPRVSQNTNRGTRRHDDFDPMDREIVAPESLATFVLEQLAADLEPEDRKLALYILASLDDDGFLQDPPVIIARMTRAPISQVNRVLQLISHVDPPGLATSGPQQALQVQLDLLPNGGQKREIAKQLLQDHFAELGRREFEKIASHLDISANRVRQAAEFIHDNLSPYPARSSWGSGRQPQPENPEVYHSPDISITHSTSDDDDSLVVEIFAPVTGWLRVNPLFKKYQERQDGDLSEEWKEHIERASLFVKCLQQRNNTVCQVMENLVAQQREYILKGDRYLRPMTRAELADKIGVHESTISRAVAQKAVAFPDGRILPLSRFFDRSLSVRDRIKEIVKNEKRPLTDEQIAKKLHKEGIKIARRTVAKYRSIEGILPARLRHRDSKGNHR
jgi:RNA polymerase sigma-54 factor